MPASGYRDKRRCRLLVVPTRPSVRIDHPEDGYSLSRRQGPSVRTENVDRVRQTVGPHHNASNYLLLRINLNP